MKTLTQEELEKRMKHWISNRDEILDFYVKLADEPTKRMIEQTIRPGRASSCCWPIRRGWPCRCSRPRS